MIAAAPTRAPAPRATAVGVATDDIAAAHDHCGAAERVVSLPVTLAPFVHGRHDPTTRRAPGRFVRATLTPDGPATLELRWRRDVATTGSHGLDAQAWGPGADWMLARVGALTGDHDEAPRFAIDHPVVARAAHDHRALRIGASGDLYHELLPTILEQRITAGEALRQWSRLCRALGRPAPGPYGQRRAGTDGALHLPPSPASLARRPTWWFHPLGIEAKRARTLSEVARVAHHLWRWADEPRRAAGLLERIPGVGRWTIGSVGGPALGDPDALAVGDYHLKNIVSNALAGEARGTDERMLELLEPYAGQRGRVVRMLLLSGASAPKFGPRQRVLPMHRW